MNVLNRKKKRSAHGEDRITYEMLRQLNLIKANKRQGFVSAMICIDLSNAFNAVQTETFERILLSYSVPNDIVTWMTGILRNRRVIMHLNDGTVSRTISNGLPQGDVLSPTLPIQLIHGWAARDIRW